MLRRADTKTNAQGQGSARPQPTDILNEVGRELSPFAGDAGDGNIIEESARKFRDAQGTFAHGTPAEVAAETERNLAVLAPGSGLVCATIHNIQANVAPDNIIALFNTAKNFRINQ